MKRHYRLIILVLSLFVMVIGFQNCSDFAVATFSSIGAIFDSSSTSSVGQIRRLSNYEYQNSLADVLAAQLAKNNQDPAWGAKIIGESNEIQNGLSALPADSAATKFATSEMDMDVTDDHFSGYMNVGILIGSELVSSNWIPKMTNNCESDSTTMDATCVDQFITDFATFAFRTPPTAAEKAELKKQTSWTSLIAKILSHPRFLAHIERDGKRQADGSYQLTPYEIEARIAAVFTKSVPDAAGIQVAASGSLATASSRRAEALRLFATQRSHDAMWRFFQQWLGANRVPTVYGTGDPAYVAFSAPITNDTLNNGNTMHDAVLEDAREFLDYHVFNSGTLADIFKSTLMFTTDPGVASIYGVAPRANTSVTPTADPSGHYQGILSRQMFTQQTPGTEGDINHIERGVLILQNVAGISLGQPAAAALQLAAAVNIPAGVSTRMEQTLETSQSACMSCHQMINPAGFTLAHFDSLGRYITTETRYRLANGSSTVTAANNVDSSVNLQLGAKFYPASDLPTLVDALLESGFLYQGFANYYFNYAFGRQPTSTADLQIINSLIADLKTKPLSEALLNIATQPGFAVAVPPGGPQ